MSAEYLLSPIVIPWLDVNELKMVIDLLVICLLVRLFAF